MKTTYLSRLLVTGSLFFCLNAFAQNFTWLKGANTSSITGTYGTQGAAAPANNPGGRHGCATWTDASGNKWLFGGEGYSTSGTISWLNDLWKYNPTTNQWTWMKGSSGPNAIGVYGTQGVAAPGNTPGAREFPVCWTDAAGNFWLYGGLEGYSSFPNLVQFADLWKYNPLTNQWTWIKGPNTMDVNGVYGTQNVAAPGNFPGSRYGSATWIDNNGKFWLFGGYGFASSNAGFLGDTWRYDPVTNQWTWVNGANGADSPGSYGTISVPAPGNAPGSRRFPGFWSDASGNLFIFGGNGHATTVGAGYLADMWTFNITTGIWTWIHGPNAINQPGIYGSLGIPATGNRPGGRLSPASWKDAMGNYWLFGGEGFDINSVNAQENDLWKYNPATNQWAWMKGANTVNQSGIYGTQGVAAPANMPGSRYYNSWWKDVPGNTFWLFGGLGFDITNNPVNNMNDLWSFNISCTSSVSAASNTLCSGNSTSLTAFNALPLAVNWYTTSSGGSPIGSGSVFALPPLTATSSITIYTYFVEVNSCTAVPRSAVSIMVYPQPQLNVAGPSSVCPGSTGIFAITGASSYTWNNGSTSNTISIGPNAPVICQGEDLNGCKSSVSFTLGTFIPPVINANSTKQTICRGETAVLTATGATTYSWNGVSGSSTLAVSPTVSTTYTILGIDQNGCSTTHTITEFVASCNGIFEEKNSAGKITVYPNPNTGSFQLLLPSEAELTIVNQLGQIVVETKLAAGLSLVETSLSQGIYLYTITFKDKTSGTGKLMIE
jgi:N-acetylneuraminic acid mutarotase